MNEKIEHNRLRIVMFGHKRIPSREGGIEIVVEELATRMVALGHNVTCYNRTGHHVSGVEYDVDERRSYKGINIKNVWTLDKKGLAALSASFIAAWKAAWSKADIVHIHAEGPAALSLLPKVRGKKVIVTIHGLDWQRAKWGRFASLYIKWGEKQAVKHANEIIVLSRGMQDYFMREYGRSTIFIPNGVNKVIPRSADIIKKKWGLEKDKYILFLGRIVPEKGILYLIEAWKKINTEKKLVIAGGSSDTDGYVRNMKALASDVIWTGFVQGKVLEELYSNAYVYCLPSDVEGMPLSLLEAMSYGNCCLVSDIEECVEVVEDKAVVFKKGNIEDLKEKLEKLINDRSLVEVYKKKAADYILEKYNWNNVVRKTLEIYRGEY